MTLADIQLNRFVFELSFQLIPLRNLVFTTGEVFIKRDVELLNLIWSVTFDEPGSVFSKVFA